MKIPFKKWLIFICAFALSLGVAGCGSTYIPPENGGEDSPSVTPPESSDKNPADSSESEEPFKVKLMLGEDAPFDGEAYSAVAELSAVWTNIDDSKDVTSTRFNSDGEAAAELDGDYRVTLSGLPQGYTYDSNSYVADNFNKTVEILMIPLKTTQSPVRTGGPGGGAERIEWLKIATVKTGEVAAYRVTVKSGEEVKFYFCPGRSGYYSVSSICDVYANRIKPSFAKYVANSNSGYYNGKDIEAEVGITTASSYSKNFIYYFEAENGSDELFFSVGAESKDGGDIVLDFVVKKEQEPEKDTPEVVVSQWDFDSHPFTVPQGGIVMYGEAVGKDLSDDDVELRDDGFYYVKETGEMLFAPLNDKIHMKFIQRNGDGAFLTYLEANLKNLRGKNYEQMIKKVYKEHLVKGCYPVNEELKRFLADYATGNGDPFFFDNTSLGKLENLRANCDYCGYAIPIEYNGVNCPHCGERLIFTSDKQSQWLATCCVIR